MYMGYRILAFMGLVTLMVWPMTVLWVIAAFILCMIMYWPNPEKTREIWEENDAVTHQFTESERLIYDELLRRVGPSDAQLDSEIEKAFHESGERAKSGTE